MGRSSGKHAVRFLAVIGLGVAVMAGSATADGGRGHDHDDDECTPGAPGIGDEYFPTYGNGGYDVREYELDVAYDPSTDELEGEAEIDAKATQDLCSFNLDLVGMEVDKVEVDDKRARFSRAGQELVITPRRSLDDRERFDVEVRYDGVPTEFTIPGTDIRTGFMATPEGATVAGQPEVSAGWYPVNDHPLDKASYEFDVTVPRGYEVAANGFLRDVDRHRRSVTWEWEAEEPMASYLATIDISDEWDVTRTRTEEQGLPQYDAVDPRIADGVRAEIDDSFSRQGEILDLLINAFGPYPFSTIGGIVPNQNDFGFALETQTRPVYTKLFWVNSQGVPRDADWVVVHELAHQWFGDDVALARWQDIWLNEGFASYAEWLWEEHEGRATPQEIFQATYDAIPASDPFWSVVIGDPGVDLLFDGAVYTRGAMTLQALRNEVGDDDFWEIVREWAANQSGGHGTTPEFIALAEEISGQQLDALFDVWLFTGAKPALAATGQRATTQRQQADAKRANWLPKAVRRLQDGRY
jgi:aminopeptidase N